jgi:UDP-3-O-[3-hydroxymyristoyl] glucosamine N-acyltransferase
MKQFSLQELATLIEGTLKGDPHKLISDINSLGAAQPHEAAFLENHRYETKLRTTQAGVVLVSPYLDCKEVGTNLLLTESPSNAFQKLIELFREPTPSGFIGVHPTAVVHPSTRLPNACTIGPYAVVDQGCTLGEGVHIGAHCFIGAGAVLGKSVYLYPHSTIREKCILGDRVIVQPGAVVGSCGFGYHTTLGGIHEKHAQLGNVVIEDDVEIGANTTIDRSRFQETRIRRGTKIDNLVQIGHQVELGEDNLIVSQVGIAGSTKTGRHVVLGGQSGVGGHLELTDGVMLAACSAASKSLDQPGPYYGTPCMPEKEFKEFYISLKGVKKLKKEVKELKAKLKELAASP